MSDIKYQAGGYQPNQQTGGYQPNPSFPPQGPPMMVMTVPQPQQNYENFDKKKAKVWSIILLVLGCLTLIVTILSLGFLGIFAFPIPILAGILGILSAKQPSQGKIVSFMILSIISAVIAGIMILICISVSVVGGLIGSADYGDYDVNKQTNDISGGLLISGIFGIIFYLALMIVSIYCSTLCCKESGCCGSKSHPTQGVVHGQIHQPAGTGVQYLYPQNPPVPGTQYMQPQNLPSQPPPYSHAIQQA